MAEYIAKHGNGTVLTKSELAEYMELDTQRKIQKGELQGKDKSIRREGRDSSDIFWTLGKIHGLENIIFVDPEDL